MPKILIICFENIAKEIIEEIKKSISKIFNSIVLIYPKNLSLPKCRKRNSQLNAEDFLPTIAKIAEKEDAYCLAITEKDLYVENLNFIFGLASQFQKSCIISLARLKGNLFLERAVKEATHELGHLFNLQHCPSERCVMHFSNCLADTDYKNNKPCQSCIKKLEKYL